jgi:hypothetical protein
MLHPLAAEEHSNSPFLHTDWSVASFTLVKLPILIMGNTRTVWYTKYN